MKKAIFALLSVLIIQYGYCQKTTSNPNYEYRQLKRKAVIAKIPGIALTAAGGACIIASLPFLLIKTDKPNETYYSYSQDENKINNTIGTIFLVAGASMELASIPFWIKGTKLMKKAKEAKLGINSSTFNIPNHYLLMPARQLGLTLSIKLGS